MEALEYSTTNSPYHSLTNFNDCLINGKITEDGKRHFKTLLWNYYAQSARNFAWRQTHDPYHIVVSEIMLQQTQTDRVARKFEEFITALPTFSSLSQASLQEILTLWQGLGYNRRALALQKIAQLVIEKHNGMLPNNVELLKKFPGLGAATAASVCAFAFNIPTVFIETNIRTVFIAHFFQNQQQVHDKSIIPLVEQTVDQNNPREWYYALMDYGVMLKKSIGNVSRKSLHYTKQSRFEGSHRQIRGLIIKHLAQAKTVSLEQLLCEIPRKKEELEQALISLMHEGFVESIEPHARVYQIKKIKQSLII
jgi:A/G-specific adenine glycosylase